MTGEVEGSSGVRELARDLQRYVEHLARHRAAAYLPRPAALARRSAAAPGPPGAASGSPGPDSPSAGDARQALAAQAASWGAATKLEYLRQRSLGDCQRCPLARSRRNIVFGAGNPEADIVFVGEAPGAEEDRTGQPFVGAAGKRLDAWLEAVNLSRSRVYIANVLKCRPPGNRDPDPREVDTCSRFLAAQLRAIEPKVIVALGRHAAMLLSGREEASLGSLRRGQLSYVDAKSGVRTPLIATYHPAFVLRLDGDRQKLTHYTDLVLEDLSRARTMAGG